MSYMGSEFDKILKQYGHDVYLNRRIRSDGHDQGSYSDVLEIHTVRHILTFGLTSQDEAMEGILNTSERFYWFRLNAQPLEGDRIYEAEPDLRIDKTIPQQIDQTVWVIEAVIPNRGLNGEIDFYKVGVSRFRPS